LVAREAHWARAAIVNCSQLTAQNVNTAWWTRLLLQMLSLHWADEAILARHVIEGVYAVGSFVVIDSRADFARGTLRAVVDRSHCAAGSASLLINVEARRTIVTAE
jgi:hypothetical protein